MAVTDLSAALLMLVYLTSALFLLSALWMAWRSPAEQASAAKAAPEKTGPDLQRITGQGKDSAAVLLRKHLSQAGFSHADAPKHFAWAKAGFAAVGLLGGLMMLRFQPMLQGQEPGVQIGLVMIAAVLFYFVPVSVVDKRRAAWLRRIELALPDALDFLLICVEAGQSTDVAVKRVAEELAPVHPELSGGFVTLTEALAAGADRQEAWLRLASDTDNDDLRQLAVIVMQSATMGTPVAQTLRVFSADLRDRRVRKIEERANILPTKMTLGTMIFTIPPLLILLLSPAIYRIISSF